MLSLSRRALAGLAGLTGLVATTSACDPLGGSASAPVPKTPDQTLVETVITEIRRARDLAEVNEKADLVALHDGHLAALGAPVPAVVSGSASPSAPRSVAVAPLDPQTAESTLKTQLTTAAIQAEDGALARVLASMSAAVAQQIEVLR